MNSRHLLLKTSVACGLVLIARAAEAQVTRQDYDRAAGLREKLQGLAVNVPERAEWIESTSRFWYRKSVAGGHEFMLVDAAAPGKRPAFDHARLAESLSKASGEKCTALKLPFQTIAFVGNGVAIEFDAGESRWRATLADYSVKKTGAARGRRRGGAVARPPERPPEGDSGDAVSASPDGAREAFIRNYNIFLRAKGKNERIALSHDGSEGNYYSLRFLTWSPDSKKLVAYRIRPGYRRRIHYVESSPAGQLQPRYISLEYAKPGDVVDLQQPVLFHVDPRKVLPIDNQLFDNPYELSRPVWRKDSRAFTFEYNQRGHQVYRVLEVDAASGTPRAMITERAETFFCYSGKKFRHDVADGKEIVWMSERDGWNHLYLYDGATGELKKQITRGPWVVRGVEKVDEQRRQIFFRASGMHSGKDPYFNHYFRIDFDGSGLTALTIADANHVVSLSPDLRYYVDTWSRVDVPTASDLRRIDDLKTIVELERGDVQDLVKAGWRAPEALTALGRDGKSDIWGIIYRPMNFDPAKKYPVVESIYAGPQDSFVPKSFSAYNPMQSLAELGFIVVQIDGMGTSNRSKAFHDVCWKNLADAGFQDRILWHKAAAAKYPWYDISRVGVYGNSAGGQNALGALLFHGDFYKVAVSSYGCHDNRMDKIWWNEQWMGWPLGPEYIACSNVENAHRLKGKLLLSVGEMDTNVDPASTMQVVNALVKANKVFDLLVLPGQGHSPGGPYGERKRNDFFVHHLLGMEPPDWNVMESTRGEAHPLTQ